MPKTYSSLYPQIVREIDKRVGKSITSIGSRFSVQPGGEGGSLDSRALAEMISTITEDISEIIGAKIITGLDVTATTPASTTINIASGTASSHGKLWELSDDTTIKIPLDSTTYVFFVTIYNNAIEITRTHDSTKAELCRIIVPKPGATSAIVDDKPKNGYDAYIVSAKDIVYKEDQEFDDASIEKLRDVIGDILADNLIGNIRLSENLKIINTQGSLELDSLSLKIKDTDENVLAKFNRNGTLFYDTTGRTLAKFATDEAYLGNILITKNSIQTRNFSSGALGSGFQILDNGNAEFNNIFLRGKLSASVFEYDTISAVGGNVLITKSADKLDQNMTTSSTTLVTSGDVTFEVGDILEMKTDATNIEFFEVTAVTSSTTYTITRDKGATGAIAWQKGAAIVNYGAANDGGIFMTASETNAPYLNVFTHTGEPWTLITTRLRLGNLNGFLGYASDLYGIAIGEDTKYLKYDPTNGLRIAGSSVISSASGARIEIFPDVNTGLIAYDDASAEVFKILVGGADVGDVIIGDYAGGQYVYYDKSAGTMTFGGGGLTNLADRAYVTTLVFSATDADTAAWSSGSIKFSDATTKTIDAGNTGNIAATTYVYFDDDVSQTVLQTTTTYSTAIGENKLLLAIVEIGTSQCAITTSPVLGTVISGANIATGTIIAAKLSISQLSAIVADLGTITAGIVTGATIQTAASGARVLMNTTNLIAYDDAAAEVFKVLVTGADVGDVIIGDYASNKGIKWDKSAGTFNIKGILTATSGDFTGTINVGTAGKVYIDGANEVIKVYDASNNLRVELGLLS